MCSNQSIEISVLSKKALFRWAQGYAKISIDNGYQNTNFLGMLPEIDLGSVWESRNWRSAGIYIGEF